MNYIYIFCFCLMPEFLNNYCCMYIYLVLESKTKKSLDFIQKVHC